MLSANVRNAGASELTMLSRTPLNKDVSLTKLSLASSTPLTALADNTTPRSSTSSNISCKAAVPPCRVFMKATPSLSNNLKARRTRSPLLSTCSKASASSSICFSSGCCASSRAFRPSSINASFASPVPLAASDKRRVKRCTAISTVRVSTPANSEAYRSFCNSAVVTPSLLAVLPRASILSSDDLTSRPRPAAPAKPTSAVFIFRMDRPTPAKAALSPRNTLPVVSLAAITIWSLF